MQISIKSDSKRWAAASCAAAVGILFCGQMVAWELRGLTPIPKSQIFPALPILATVALLTRPKWLFGARMYASPLLVALLILLVFFPFATMSLIDTGLNLEQIVYMSMLCVVTLLISFNDPEDFSALPFAVMVIGGVGCILSIFELLSDPLREAARLIVNGNDNPLAIASNGLATAVAALVVGLSAGKNRLIIGLVAALAFCAGAANVVLSVTRSSMLSLGVCCAIYIVAFPFWVRSRRDKDAGGFRTTGFIVGLLCCLISAAFYVSTHFDPKLVNTMLTFVQERLGSILDVASGSTDSDTSSTLHAYLLDYNLSSMNLLGHGIMAQAEHLGPGLYAHNIYVQAFFDLGALGGLVVLVTGMVLPSSLIVVRAMHGRLEPYEALIVLLFIDAILSQMTHGTPYSWQSWVPTVLICTLLPAHFTDPKRTQ